MKRQATITISYIWEFDDVDYEGDTAEDLTAELFETASEGELNALNVVDLGPHSCDSWNIEVE